MREYILPGSNNRLIVKKCGRYIGAVLYSGHYGFALNDKRFIAALIRQGRFSRKVRGAA